MMDAVQRVLPSVNIISSEKAAKDTQQKKQDKYKSLQLVDDENEQITSTHIKTVNQINDTIELERRTGADRRLSAKKRGRWLESRGRKNRRTSLSVSMKI